MKEIKDEFPKKEIKKEEASFSFTVLSGKIKSLMDTLPTDEEHERLFPWQPQAGRVGHVA